MRVTVSMAPAKSRSRPQDCSRCWIAATPAIYWACWNSIEASIARWALFPLPKGNRGRPARRRATHPARRIRRMGVAVSSAFRGASEGRHHFDLFARADHEVCAFGPNGIVQQQLERQLFGARRGPAPGIAIDALARHAPFPAQTGSLAAKINGVAETDIDLGLDGGGSRRGQ